MPDGTCQPDARTLPPPGRVQLPADWGVTLGPNFHGCVRYRRYFHRPTGLENVDRVELVLEEVDAHGIVELNGVNLGEVALGEGAGRFDVTDRLIGHNELCVHVESPRIGPDHRYLSRPGREGLPGGLIGEVRLEIYEQP